MTTDSGNELAERLAGLGRLNDIDDAVGVTSADCNYEDFEDFTGSVDLEFFEQDHAEILKELKKLAENVLISGEKCDVRSVFEESGVAAMKFNLYIWYFLENGRKSESSEEAVRSAVYAASTYLSMCALKGANTQLYQVGLYNQCLKVARNCCHTIRIGEIVASKKAAGARKKKGGKKNETVRGNDEEEEEESENVAAIGPPRIAVDSAERFLHHVTTGLFGFLLGNTFSIDEQTILTTLEMIEDLGRLDLDTRTSQRCRRANSVHEFRSLERFTDRYTSFVHALIESKYQTRRNMAYGRLIRPRLALIPYPDDGNKTAKISTERKRAGELTANLILSRIERKPDAKELKLIETVLVMVYTQCPDLAEFRTNVAQSIHKILEALPYQYAYDFVQLMNVMYRGRSAGVKSLSTELANLLISGFDFTAPDPGPVPEVALDGEQEIREEEEQEEQEEEEPEEEPPAERESEDDDSDDENNKTKRMREKKQKEEEKQKKKKEKKKAQVKDVDRVDASSVLYNIVYLACLDKSAAMRLHGSHSLAKVLASVSHRNAFQEFCQLNNASMDEKLGAVGDDLNESSPDTSNHDDPGTKKPTDLLLGEQQIIEKFNKLKLMNKGEVRVEKDIIYMLVRRLASDEKVPVKKSSSLLLKLILSYCDEEIKFETLLRILQKQCRDKNASMRKTSGEALTDLMFNEDILFKDILGSKWLHSLISMLNDNDSDVTEHARKLIMKVLTPLLESPSDLTWTLLDTIESVTNHRHYIMSALKGAVREKLVKKSVIDKMKDHILSRSGKENGAWMVFSQLCVEFQDNADFAIEEFNKVDLSKPLNTLQYMVHIIENNAKHINDHVKREFIDSLQRTLNDYCLHASHARSIYHCLGRLMNGIGDRSEDPKQLEDFGDQLIVKCFDTIVQSFDMFKDKEEWKRNAEFQERLLCTSLNVAIEVFTYSPQLIQRHERLAKTLSLIVNSYDANSTDASTINPEMPSAHHTRPNTQLSQYPQSQEGGGIMTHEGLLFSDNVRAVSVVTLVNMIVAHDRLLKLMPPLVKQLQRNPSHQIRSNIVVALGDVCNSFKTDRYAPMLAASLCDPSVLVRRHAINQIARLICNGIFRFNGEIMIRMMLGTLDANEDVRNDAKLYISEVLQAEDPSFFKNNFVQYMLALTQARRLVGVGYDEDETGQIDIAIGGGISLARPSRIAIYTFMIESLDDRSKYEVKKSISERIFFPIVNGEYEFKDPNTQCLLDDALLIMASNEMQVKMEVGKDPNENALDEPPAEAIEAATGFMQKVYLENYMKVIVPSMLALREFLHMHRSTLQRKCVVAIKMICTEHKNDIDEILAENPQLKEEILFEMQRVKKRTEEAHKILDEYLKRVVEFKKQQKRLSKSPLPMEVDPEVPEIENVEMRSPANTVPVAEVDEMADESMRTPVKKNPALDALRTPGTALRSRTEEQHCTPGSSRALSPKTLRKIRRSVGALINNAPEERLNALNLEDTNVEEEQLSTSRRLKKPAEKENTIVEEESVEAAGQEKAVAVPPVEEEAPEEQEQVEQQQEKDSEIRRSKRKTPTYNDDESIDADGKVWKKPKIVSKSPEKDEANISANVTLRRSRRVSRQAEPIPVEKPKTRKRKTTEEDEDEEEDQNPSEGPSTSDNVENTPRGQTPLVFDESKLRGRLCSTPINGSDSDANDMTFGLSDVSAIVERESMKNRKSCLKHLQEIFEDDEDEEEGTSS